MIPPSGIPAAIRFRPGVQFARHKTDVVILVGDFSRRPVRLTGASSHLVDLLAAGCSHEDLCARLEQLGYSRAAVGPAVESFLARLSSMQVLHDSTRDSAPAEGPRAPRMIEIDPLARLFARPFLFLPPGIVGAALSMASVTAASLTVIAIWDGWLLMPPAYFHIHALWGLWGIVPWVIAHEFSHAIACRAQGCRVSGLGVRFRMIGGASFFVDTRYAALLKGRWAKAWVALVGLWVDLLALGTISGALLRLNPGSTFTTPLGLLFFVVAFGLFLNLNPWRASDGSNALSALTDDPLLVDSLSLRTPRKKSRARGGYRVWALLYLGIFLSIALYLARSCFLILRARFH